MNRILTCVVAAALVAGCAASPETNTAPAGDRAEKEFTTGSNIPRRNRMGGDAVSTMTREEFERARTAGGQGDQGGMPGTSGPGAR